MHDRARAVLPDVTHVGRFLAPHPIYVERAAGSRKWDVDGNEYVDYLGGHGALVLGHGYPSVVEAVTAQAVKGVHYGACHELEVRWACGGALTVSSRISTFIAGPKCLTRFMQVRRRGRL